MIAERTETLSQSDRAVLRTIQRAAPATGDHLTIQPRRGCALLHRKAASPSAWVPVDRPLRHNKNQDSVRSSGQMISTLLRTTPNADRATPRRTPASRVPTRLQ